MLLHDPQWYKDAVIYELHVRAFYDSSGDGIGDFAGLAQKLDYLQDLGVTAIWLLPFYPSPLRDDGYDIADYTSIHPDYGTLEEFEQVLEAAHARGLRVITELVINHTSEQHPWFQRARRAAPGTPERDFYVWSDTPELYSEARIIFKDFETSNWAWDKTAHAYYWHRFYAHQPDLNFDNPAVWDAIFPVVDFWFEKGVDGLRLDAVPYLYERPGTNCENLPETHAFLRALRRHVDEKFPDRMLLAEANQWPEDAVAYFGEGDECHMAFHFPLMPRMFMAIHMEDRLPIIDIMEQTPTLPEACQWALFLRNHDELTLEMVTDEERDYMYQAYASDPRARINLGIRHRLAPLLGNNRRRIELMNGLLFSFPGTPVLYYGDEIGMGDNIFLGDRNGVRTPMQWSADRNAGFSRANPQQLYLPIIIDPEYHYETVNVEAQQNNAHSLLWWTKRLIGLRRRHRALGWGTLTFLRPNNRRVLAFIRQYEDETILVVANLSRFAQHAELDLSAFEGMAPVELFGQTRFPTIGRQPYPTMLGPHSFFWFALVPSREWEVSGADDLESLPRITGVSDRGLARGAPEIPQIERALRKHLNQQYPPDDRKRLAQLTIRDIVRIASEGNAASLVLLEGTTVPGASTSIWLPLIVWEGDDSFADRPPQLKFVAHIDGAPSRWLCDASGLSEFNHAAYDVIYSAKTISASGGATLQGVSSATAIAELELPTAGTLPVRFIPGDGGRSATTFGDVCVLSYRREPVELDPPESEMSRWLTESGRFEHAPRWLGSLQYQRPRRPSLLLAELHAYVPNEGNAWQYTLDELSAFFDRLLASPVAEHHLHPEVETHGAPPEAPSTILEAMGTYLEDVRCMGERLAALHHSLCSAPADPEFAPEEFTSQYQRSLYQSLRSLTSDALFALSHLPDTAPPDVLTSAEAICHRQEEIHAHFHGLLQRRIQAWRTRIHGDLHLGQLLRAGSEFLFTGFDGGGRSAAHRRIKRSPLSDLAGLLHSLEFASRGALHGVSNRHGGSVGVVRPEDYALLQKWAEAWRQLVLPAAIDAYHNATSSDAVLAHNDADFRLLLSCLRWEQALLEVRRQAIAGTPSLMSSLEILMERLAEPVP